MKTLVGTPDPEPRPQTWWATVGNYTTTGSTSQFTITSYSGFTEVITHTDTETS